ARAIHRLDDFAVRGERARVTVLDHGDAIDDPEIGHERALERRRPARLAGRDFRLLARAESRQREADRREVRARVERPSELLEEHRLLDETEPGAALLL